MKRFHKITVIIIILIISIAIGFKVLEKMNKTENKSIEKLETSLEDEVKPEIDPVKQLSTKILERMTLEQKIGQMLIIRNRYTDMTPEYEDEITKIQPGGYIIFSENITTLEGTQHLVNNVREKIESASSVLMEDETVLEIPAIMSIDQEGGLVQRLQSISDYPPKYVDSMGKIGASGSTDVAYETGRLLAEECMSVGFNVNYAPVADIFSNPKNTVIGNRAFGTDKDTVATMSIALAHGLSDSGVIPVFKHFPGHGDTVADSHQSLPIVTKTLEELMENEIYPFRKAIEDGAEMIMVAHIALPNITGDYTPASLSPMVITDILKGQLNYDGLVITDGLDMGALTSNYSNSGIAVQAVTAGADLLLTPVSPLEAKNAIVAAIEDGTISEARINESISKILEFKLRHFN